MAVPQGYQCELIDQVFDDLYCKKCSLVARRIVITSCCAESFCQGCIATCVTDQCPACGEKGFSTLQHAKNQKRIDNLRVYCTMKERGCGWSGPLDQLDTHLDPDQDNCQYVDIKCSLNCKQAIPKNKMEQHVAEECVKRDYFCQYCSFKASYEEVVDKHLPECVYVPLNCPNMCGVTFERDFLEDHMKMCPLEEIECEFNGVGCLDRFRREDQEEHARQNSHKHLSLTALVAVGTKEQLQQKILEQDRQHRATEQKSKEKIEELQKELKDLNKKMQHQFDQHGEEELKAKRKLQQQEKQLQELNKQLKEGEVSLKKKLEEQKRILEYNFVLKQDKKIEKLEKRLEDREKQLQDLKEFSKETLNLKERLEDQKKTLEHTFDQKLSKLKEVLNEASENRTSTIEKRLTNISTGVTQRLFEIKNFSKEKAKGHRHQWQSPPMYTHMCGYKFCATIYLSGQYEVYKNTICLTLVALPGEYDSVLKWPVKAEFTVQLINQRGGENMSTTAEATWNPVKTKKSEIICFVNGRVFIEHSKLRDFLANDTLYFNIPTIKFL